MIFGYNFSYSQHSAYNYAYQQAENRYFRRSKQAVQHFFIAVVCKHLVVEYRPHAGKIHISHFSNQLLGLKNVFHILGALAGIKGIVIFKHQHHLGSLIIGFREINRLLAGLAYS